MALLDLKVSGRKLAFGGVLLLLLGVSIYRIKQTCPEPKTMARIGTGRNDGADSEWKNDAPPMMNGSKSKFIKKTPMIYAVTPTYKRLTQKADLTRLSQTLKHVDRLVWVVVENANKTSDIIQAVLERSNISFVYISKYGNAGVQKGEKGVLQRNAALKWIRNEYKTKPVPASNGVICFLDDDNTYDLRLFEEMTSVKRVGVTAVGHLGGMIIERPIVNNGKITGFNAEFGKNMGRKFPVDMAGIVVNLKFFLDSPVHGFPLTGYPTGLHESVFIESFNLTREMLEPFGMKTNKYGRKEVLAWHTRTENPNIFHDQEYKKKNLPPSDLNWEA